MDVGPYASTRQLNSTWYRLNQESIIGLVNAHLFSAYVKKAKFDRLQTHVLALANTLRFEWNSDFAVLGCFLRSWDLRLLKTCVLFHALFRPTDNNRLLIITQEYFDVCCRHWKLCSCDSIGKGRNVRENMSGGKCPKPVLGESRLWL